MPVERLEDWETAPEPLPAQWYQRRGRAFEKVIKAVLSGEGLGPRTNIRPSGEEIDGSFVLNGRTYLLEAKWRKEPIPASDLYAFKGKVDGKLVGTIGVFISMSGFSEDAVDALKFGKEINLILFDGRDFRQVASGRVTFAAALLEKLRYAAEEGQPFLPLVPEVMAGEPPAEVVAPIPPLSNVRGEKWQIVVEGETDALGLRIIISRLEPSLSSLIRFWPAGGQLALASLFRNLRRSGSDRLAVVVDGDVAPAVMSELREELEGSRGHLLVLQPSLEGWLESACPADYINAVPATGVKAKAMRRVAAHADLERLAQTNRKFTDFVRKLKE